MARLGPLFDKVCSVHGKNHPELLQIRASFQGLAQELTMHMMKEEMVLFPYIVRMEESVIQKEPVLPSPFGSVQNPVTMMMQEHDSAGEALRAMRQASAGYTPPGDACISFQTLYKALATFEADLHQQTLRDAENVELLQNSDNSNPVFFEIMGILGRSHYEQSSNNHSGRNGCGRLQLAAGPGCVETRPTGRGIGNGP